MTQDKMLEQEKIYTESKSQFKLGDVVKHKTASEFKMVIVDFEVKWINNPHKTLQGFKNPEYVICKYYNTYTNKWVDRQSFNYVELVLES
jgi:uncharacterized protein YodC (DUF2158 family)